ncbi:GNAT family N-acetyltransferase [Hymenobacter crusticola]|uniref:GNAT family N-acetyltransferase n=1 Tax=Hymenobacter crusticola TaxID=1770526 RepID=A0A243WJA6_9BACT|nr:GNAT family N-acetyltransferase [Hymenobacter crusticola]OUJ75360.1 GNAT family N-acetyltransferase [Hymenobacter crusticola]
MYTSLQIAPATPADIPALVTLVNSAYRGEESRQGWTTEADLLEGIRTDADSLHEMLQTPAVTILKCTDSAEQLLGCVYLKQKGDTLYLGMLSVKPGLQTQGIGKQLLQAGETYARHQHCRRVTMTVISVRHELIAWYERRGYQLTGATEPFPTSPKFGIPNQVLTFVVMEKALS